MTERDSDVSQKSGEKTGRRKTVLGASVAAAIALVLATALPGLSRATAENDMANMSPTEGYDIHVTVGRHDSMHLDAQMDHYCKLDSRIVAVCQLYAHDNNAMPGTGPQLSQIEFIITEDQYKQLPAREKANWHNHAVELTPERGSPSCVDLPEGLTCGALVETLKKTYGKVITIWDPADPVPSYPPYAYLVDSPFALGQDLNDNLHKEWPTSCGENASSPSLECKQFTLTVKAAGPDGGDLRMFIRIGEDGKIISEGFAPFKFNATEGKAYQVRATNFQDLVFDRWEDNGSTDRHRMVTLTGDLELKAIYKSKAPVTPPAPEDKKEFTTSLSGAEEVPPVATNAAGTAELKVGGSSTNSTLSYRVTVKDIDNVTAAHLHLAPKGSNGPVVVTLYNATAPADDFPGGVLAEGIITSDMLTGPMTGMGVDDLVDKIRAGEIYANVHTTEYPGGEIRGQFD